jgi:hypothetical protein
MFLSSALMMLRGKSMRTVKALFFLASSSLLATSLTGCGPTIAEAKVDKTRKVYRIATRQHPPEPVYSRTRWVRPPEIKPERENSAAAAPLILPVVQLEVADAPLKEVAQILAATSRYRSYCAPSISQRTVSITSLGTIEELAHQIELEAGIRVVVDHTLQEIRFLGGQSN